jgi:hypothetical protein
LYTDLRISHLRKSYPTHLEEWWICYTSELPL